MGNKINVSELLKDCPKGMELDCVLYEDCKFLDIDAKSNSYLIRITTPCGIKYLDKYGCYTTSDKSKCVIFPKGKTTWEEFQRPFKDGDVIYNRLQKKICIYYLCEDEVPRIKGCRYNESNPRLQFEKLKYTIPIAIQDYRLATGEEKIKLFKAIKNNGYHWNNETKTLEELPKFKDGDVVVAEDSESLQLFLLKHLNNTKNNNGYNGCCYFGWDFLNNRWFGKGNWGFDRLATEEEKAKLFQIVKDNGYRWNPETKTLERLPEFKVGDKIKHKDTVLTIITVQKNSYIVEDEPDNFGILMFSQQDKWELVNEPKFKVGDRIRYVGDDFPIKIIDIKDNQYHIECFCDKYNVYKNGIIPVSQQDNYILIPKFDITTLKPFDKVLVRDCDEDKWKIDFFSDYNSDGSYQCMTFTKNQCIPYEGNEHLRNTTNSCDEYFKTWKDE